MFGRDRVEFDGMEWGPRQDKVVQRRVRGCEGLDRNAVSSEGTDGAGYDIDGRTEVRARDHIEEVEDDVENMTVLGHDDHRVRTIL
jgi:hypothetical protein